MTDTQNQMPSGRIAPDLSVVIPVYGCSTCLYELHRRITDAVSPICNSWEIVFVDDRSTDGSWPILADLSAQDHHVVAIRFSRNFGQQIAISAGIERARGDLIVVMDCDLQDPPEVIPELIAESRKGADVVLAARDGAYQSWGRRWANRVYFWALRILSGTKFDGDYGALSLISRKVADAYCRFPEIDRHYLFILYWLGFDVHTIRYHRPQRSDSPSSYSLRDLTKLALSGMFFQTTRLVRWVIQIGFAVAFSGALYGLVLIYKTLFMDATPPPGWTSMIVVALFMSGITIVSVGIIGLYIAKIYEQIKQRPLFVIDTELRDIAGKSLANGTQQSEQSLVK